MRILILGHGVKPIPPEGRGAVERVIWEYAIRFRAAGHEVEILNQRRTRLFFALFGTLARGRFDWVWSHHERSIHATNFFAKLFGTRVVMTSHRPVTDLPGLDGYTRRMLRWGARAGHHLCLTREIMLVNRVLNGTSKVAFAPNGVAVKDYRFAPQGNGRAIYLGGISIRKRQAEVARICGDLITFVGPLDHDDEDNRFVREHPSYIGEWSATELGDRLTEFSVLVLVSHAEAQPLVVAEAFAAGLSVVLSEAAARNVDRSLPWVHIVDSLSELPNAIAAAASTNAVHRAAIRAHAEGEWDWDEKAPSVLRHLESWSR